MNWKFSPTKNSRIKRVSDIVLLYFCMLNNFWLFFTNHAIFIFLKLKWVYKKSRHGSFGLFLSGRFIFYFDWKGHLRIDVSIDAITFYVYRARASFLSLNCPKPPKNHRIARLNCSNSKKAGCIVTPNRTPCMSVMLEYSRAKVNRWNFYLL